ncbi:Protein SUPPRESSOR OF GENE SILENCING 3 [Linum perenne]
MSSRGNTGKSNVAGLSSMESNKGKATGTSTQFDMNQGVADIKLDSAQTDGDWAVYAKKSKNKGGSSISKAWGSQNSNSKSWGQADGGQQNNGAKRMTGNAWANQPVESSRPTGRGNGKHQASNRSLGNYMVPPQGGIPPPLAHGWNWQARAGATKDSEVTPEKEYDEDNEQDGVDGEDDEDEDLDDTDDDDIISDYDSDDSQKSHNTRKNGRWFKSFFDLLDSLTLEEINESDRQWHCPACQGGPGAIDWFKGLQPLMTHARTKGAKRLKLHRELADLLDEELLRKGTSAFPSGEVFGKWKGLKEEERDFEIVWPPMVMVMNTRLDKDDNDKWTGMGNPELLDYFQDYAAVKAKHSYGPQGHRGMSILIFEASSRGYFEAGSLSRHFTVQGTDRNAWNPKRNQYYPGGKRQLYGFMATKDDLDLFNQHSHGKAKLKFEMRSYNEVVVRDYNRVCIDNEQLSYLKTKVIKEQRNAKALAESLGTVSEKLRKTMEENRIVRQRTQMYHEQNKEELDYQEEFFKERLAHIREERKAREEEFENRQQEVRKKVTDENSSRGSSNNNVFRVEEVSKFIQLQEKEMDEFVEEREKLVKLHEEKYVAMRRKHWEDEVDLEKEFDLQLTDLMNKYTPRSSGAGGNAKA